MESYQIQAMTTAVHIYSLWQALSYSTLNPHVVTGHVNGTIVPLPLAFFISRPRPCKVDTIVSASTLPVFRGK